VTAGWKPKRGAIVPALITRALACALIIALASFLQALPVPTGDNNRITDRKDFIPNRKFQALPGKAIGILVSDVEPVLNAEGRTGPKNQLCYAQNGCSYRWVYVPAQNKPTRPFLDLPIGDKGERKRFDNLSLASPEMVQPFGIRAKFALIEVEVNDRL